MNNTNPQYFYLRLEKEYTNCNPEHLQPPVGVVAFSQEQDGGIRVAVSIVSKKDQFVKKTGVAKALGRLKSRTQWIQIDRSVPMYLYDIAVLLVPGLGGTSIYSKDNNFYRIDWNAANETFVFLTSRDYLIPSHEKV